MRTVFSNDECVHVWASQEQSHGRNAKNSIFFEQDKLYSYGHHYCMAKLFKSEGVVLINNYTYSPTTGKHLSITSRAVSHYKQIEVKFPDVEPVGEYLAGDHIGNIEDIVSSAEELLKKQLRARKYNYLGQVLTLQTNLERYLEFFGIDQVLIEKNYPVEYQDNLNDFLNLDLSNFDSSEYREELSAKEQKKKKSQRGKK